MQRTLQEWIRPFLTSPLHFSKAAVRGITGHGSKGRLHNANGKLDMPNLPPKTASKLARQISKLVFWVFAGAVIHASFLKQHLCTCGNHSLVILKSHNLLMQPTHIQPSGKTGPGICCSCQCSQSRAGKQSLKGLTGRCNCRPCQLKESSHHPKVESNIFPLDLPADLGMKVLKTLTFLRLGRALLNQNPRPSARRHWRPAWPSAQRSSSRHAWDMKEMTPRKGTRESFRKGKVEQPSKAPLARKAA